MLTGRSANGPARGHAVQFFSCALPKYWLLLFERQVVCEALVLRTELCWSRALQNGLTDAWQRLFEGLSQARLLEANEEGGRGKGLACLLSSH